MPFSYYGRLSPRDQALYRKSDAVTAVTLPNAERLRPLVAALGAALGAGDRRSVEAAASALARGLTEGLSLPPVRVEVLAVRPSSGWGELHGLYTREERGPARVQLWMRTARHRRVVAFRTFLRTLLHEIGHHLDYEGLRLRDSLHTEGFFRRESSLFRQLVPADGGAHDSPLPPGLK